MTQKEQTQALSLVFVILEVGILGTTKLPNCVEEFQKCTQLLMQQFGFSNISTKNDVSRGVFHDEV